MKKRKPRELQPGEVFGHRKVIRKKYELGTHVFYETECLLCNRKALLYGGNVLKGLRCVQCLRSSDEFRKSFHTKRATFSSKE